MSLELSGTTPAIKGVAGSVAAPAITGDDVDTGISFPSANTIKFSTGGVERMSITDSGVVGAGGGKLLKYETTAYSTQVSHSGTNYVDTGLTDTIQPSAASSKILVIVSQFFNVNVANPNVGGAVQVLEGSNVIVPSQNWELYFYPGLSGNYSKNYMQRYNVIMVHTPSYSVGDTLTYKTQMKALNDGNQTNIKAQKSSSTSYLTLMELAA